MFSKAKKILFLHIALALLTTACICLCIIPIRISNPEIHRPIYLKFSYQELGNFPLMRDTNLDKLHRTFDTRPLMKL